MAKTNLTYIESLYRYNLHGNLKNQDLNNKCIDTKRSLVLYLYRPTRTTTHCSTQIPTNHIKNQYVL